MATVLFSAGNASADIYKYVDDNGVMHYSNVPTTGNYKWVMPEVSDKPRVKENKSYFSLENIINSAAFKYGLDPALIKAVIKAESDFDPSAVSRAGAVGLMQLMPATAKLLGVENSYDPNENVDGGSRYLKHLLKKFSWDTELALAAYNAGINKVLKYGRIPPFKETQRYVKKVLRYRRSYRSRASN